MSVSLSIFKNGERTDEQSFPGRPIQRVIDFLNEKDIDYRAGKGSETIPANSCQYSSLHVYEGVGMFQEWSY